MTAISLGFFLRGVSIPSDFGSHFSRVAIVSSGSIHPPKGASSAFAAQQFGGFPKSKSLCNITQLRVIGSMLGGAEVTSSCVCKKLEGAIFPLLVEAVKDGKDNSIDTVNIGEG